MLQLAFLVLVLGCYIGVLQVAHAEHSDVQPLSVEERTKYGIPMNAKVLLNAQTSCAVPPVKQRAALALGCEAIEKGRGCMEVEDDAVIFTGSFCHGKTCKMNLIPGPTNCMLSAYGVDVQVWNETRKETCGLDSEYSYWLAPFQSYTPENDSDADCVTGLTAEVSLWYWAPCLDGAPRLRTELSFTKHMGSNYSCFFNPQCSDKAFKSEIICYALNKHGSTGDLQDVKGEAASHCKFIGLTFALILLYCLRDEYF